MSRREVRWSRFRVRGARALTVGFLDRLTFAPPGRSTKRSDAGLGALDLAIGAPGQKPRLAAREGPGK